MSEQKFTPISEITDETVASIRRRTVLSLPDDPQAAGMKAATVKRRFWEGIVGDGASLLEEQRRIVREANAAMEELGEKIEGMKGGSVYIRYSAHPDGTDFSAEWQRGFNYIGVAIGVVEPTDKSDYKWSVFETGILDSRVNEIDDKVNVCESKISRNDKRITNLERGLKADSFETDASVAYTKDVPVNALPYAELAKVGGMSYREGAVLKSAPVTGIRSVGKNLIDAATAKVTTSYKNQSEEIIKNERYGTGIKMTALKDITTCWGRGGIIVGLTKDFLGKTLTVSAENVFYSSPTEKSVPVYAAQLAKRDGYYEDTSSGSYVSLGSEKGDSFTFTVNSDADYNAYPYVRVAFYPTNGGNLVVGDYVIYDDIMVEVSDTKTPYSPYTERTTPIPEAVQSLDGYGRGINELAYNYVDFEKKQFVKNVEKYIVKGGLAYKFSSLSSGGYPILSIEIAPKEYIKAETLGFVRTLSAPFESKSADDVLNKKQEGVCLYANSTDAYLSVCIRLNPTVYGCTTASTTAELIAAANAYFSANNLNVLCKLATPEITDISDILPDDNYIEVEGGGTLTFENEHKLAVPSEITYQIKEVTA